jgi:hypothetical protein
MSRATTGGPEYVWMRDLEIRCSALRREEASLDDLPRVAVANAVAVADAVAVEERVDEKLTFR